MQTCCRAQSSVGKNAEGQRLVAVQVPGVIRVVNRTTKEGEQCARLLLFRGRRCGPRPFVLVWKSRHSAAPATLALGMPAPSACRRAVPPGASQLGLPPASPLPGPQLRRAPRCPAAKPWDRRSTPPRAPKLRSGLKLSLDPARRFGPVGNMRRTSPDLATAIYRLDAFPGCLPWQDIVLMRSRRGLGREKSQFVATYCLHAFKYS